ncbi:MAG: hypothetical protein Ta2F_16730 [Termitinemataceae bacterium]|nr:MAG: hypothetical protein Ta2F_16730 [Termitinemataceae bacterium]
MIVDSIFAHKNDRNLYSDEYYLYKSLRKRFATLVATAGTTIIAALPFVFLHEDANSIIKILSLVTALGVLVSCICSLFLVPAILILFWKNFFGKKFRVAGQKSSFGGRNAIFKKIIQRWIP